MKFNEQKFKLRLHDPHSVRPATGPRLGVVPGDPQGVLFDQTAPAPFGTPGFTMFEPGTDPPDNGGGGRPAA